MGIIILGILLPPQKRLSFILLVSPWCGYRSSTGHTLAGWVVGSMHRHMTVQACPVKNTVVEHPVDGLSGVSTAARAQFAWMGCIGEASLAQVGHFGVQQRVVGRTVGGMTA